jgi:hypothetical protein
LFDPAPMPIRPFPHLETSRWGKVGKVGATPERLIPGRAAHLAEAEDWWAPGVHVIPREVQVNKGGQALIATAVNGLALR